MTVRVSKQPINLREKLSELERPIGLKGSELMGAETAQEARDLVSAGRRNMIINGAMLISQRHSSAQSIPSGSQPYFIDRFSNRNNTDGNASVSHSAEAPNGFYRSMRIEVTSPDTSLAVNQYLRFQQYIEGHNIFCDWGKGNTDHLTLSFWVRSSLPGIYSASLEDGDALPLHIKEYQIDNADTWEYKTLTFPPPPTGTFSTAGAGTGMRLTMVQSSGTQNQSSPNNWKTGSYYHASTRQVDFTKQTGNFYITGIQLEKGKNATDFEHRPYGEELALCERYFEISEPGGRFYSIRNDGISRMTVTWRTTKRAAPNSVILGISNPNGWSAASVLSSSAYGMDVGNSGNYSNFASYRCDAEL